MTQDSLIIISGSELEKGETDFISLIQKVSLDLRQPSASVSLQPPSLELEGRGFCLVFFPTIHHHHVSVPLLWRFGGSVNSQFISMWLVFSPKGLALVRVGEQLRQVELYAPPSLAVLLRPAASTRPYRRPVSSAR